MSAATTAASCRSARCNVADRDRKVLPRKRAKDYHECRNLLPPKDRIGFCRARPPEIYIPTPQSRGLQSTDLIRGESRDPPGRVRCEMGPGFRRDCGYCSWFPNGESQEETMTQAARFRELLRRDGMVVAPGAYD